MSAPLAPPPPPPPPPLPPLPSAITGTKVFSAVPSIEKQRNNYTRLCRLLIDIGTRILRGFFDSLVLHLHGDLRKHLIAPDVLNELKKLRSKRVLNTQQWDKLYPLPPGITSSTTFDITLLFLLLRNTCGLTPPTTDWNAVPSPADLSKEADLIRVKQSRNEITGHSSEAKFSDADFESHWAEIEAALLRLGHSYCHVNDYETKIKMLKIESVDKENEAYLSILLQTWEEGEERKMDTIMEKLNEIKKELHSKVCESLPEFCNLPQKPSHSTIYRTSEVSEIMSKIQHLQSTYPHEITVTYLTGNPGCGKSELARQVGKRYFDKAGESAKCVLTVNASNLESLTLSYMDLAEKLRCSEISLSTVNTINSQEQKLTRLIGIISTKLHSYSAWLMIVDNVEDLQLVSKVLPQAGENLQHGKGHVIITTQDAHSIPLRDPHAHHMPLSHGMIPADAVEALLEISGCSGEEGIVNSVAKELDLQPLALACAAVYVQEVHMTDRTMTWKKYLQHIQKHDIKSTERIYEETNNSYKMSMTNAVKMAVQKVIEKSQVMRRTFEFLAALAPEFISLHHVVNYVMKCLTDEDEKLVAAKIMKSSLVLTSKDKDGPMVRVHQVVLNVLESVFQELHCNEEDELLYLTKVIDVFSYLDSMDKHSIDYIKATRKVFEHVARLTHKLKVFFERREIFILTEKKNKYGVRYKLNRTSTIQYETITKLLKNRLLGVFHSVNNKYEICRCLLEICIALTITRFDTMKTTKECHEKGLTPGEGIYDVDQFKTEACLVNNFGLASTNLGEYYEAKECHQKALATKESKYGNNHPDVAISLNNLGSVLSKLGSYKEAKECHQNALTIYESTYGNDHPSVATSLSSLGYVLSKLGSYKEAKRCQQKALAIQESTYGSNHPLVASSLNRLGLALRDLGSYKEAKECLQKALAIDESEYGNNHCYVAAVIGNLGMILIDLGDYEKSKESIEIAIVIDETVFDENHPYIGIDLYRLGLSLHALGLIKEAKESFERSLTILEAANGEDHPRIARILNGLGELQMEQGDNEIAKQNLDRALAINETSLGANHPYVADTLNNLGRLFQSLHEYEQARRYFERALAINKETFHENHPKIAITLNNLGSLLIKMKKDKEGNHCLVRALAIKEKNPDYAFKF